MSLSSSSVKRVLITGGAGQIAYSLIPHICLGRCFGQKQKIILHLLDIPGTEQVLEGVKMELEDSSYDLLVGVVTTTDVEVAFSNLDFAVLLGGFPRKQGMERKDLIAKNVEIMKAHGRALNNFSGPNVKVLVVANPANTNCLTVIHSAPNIPPTNFTCLTRLDQERLRGMLAKKINEHLDDKTDSVSAQDLKNCIIWGNHSSTQYPSIENGEVKLKGRWVKIRDAVKDDVWITESLVPDVQNRGAAVIAARKLSSALSAAEAICQHIRDWTFGTPEGVFVSMGVISTGNRFGVPEDMVFSFPLTIRDGHFSIAETWTLTPRCHELIDTTTRELAEERSAAMLGVSHL